eukprot:6195645-Pleurochrysis_carterae.AAC.1
MLPLVQRLAAEESHREAEACAPICPARPAAPLSPACAVVTPSVCARPPRVQLHHLVQPKIETPLCTHHCTHRDTGFTARIERRLLRLSALRWPLVPQIAVSPFHRAPLARVDTLTPPCRFPASGGDARGGGPAGDAPRAPSRQAA